jgi:hypothetical protein
MSRILKRPMFRRGGEVGGGIMTGIRQNFAEAGSARDKLLEAYAAYPVQSVDPVAKLLISGGLRGLSQTGGGGTLGNLAKAFQEPTERLFEDIGAQDKGRRDLAMIGTKMDIESDLALKLAREKARAELKSNLQKDYSEERAYELLVKERTADAAKLQSYQKPNLEQKYPRETSFYDVTVTRKLRSDPRYKEIAQSFKGLLDFNQKTQEFNFENLIPGMYYYNPTTNGFLSVEPSEDGKTINYFETDFYSLNKKLLQTEILKPKPLPTEPTQ